MLRIVKVGGSLLTWNDFPHVLRYWLDQQPGTNVLLVGGGPWVELLRQSARRFEIEERTAHWLAIHALQGTTRLLSAILQPFVSMQLTDAVADLRPIDPPDEQRVILFDPYPWMWAERGEPDSLPESWHVTSDSIAARLAARSEADEVVLLKSTRPCGSTIQEWTERGIVDAEFSRSIQGIPCRVINLRGASSG